jgi:molybdopterin converting factor small subunit
MAKVLVMAPLRRYTGSLGELNIDGRSAGEVLRKLSTQFENMAPKLFREDGSLRAHFIIYVNGRDIRLSEGVDTPVGPETEIKLFAALTGG